MKSLAETARAALAPRFEVMEPIGHGGMATVYSARDAEREEIVAVKVLHPIFAATVEAARFKREIEILTRLDHPGILPILYSGSAATFVYYVMPYASGGTLEQRMGMTREPFPIAEAWEVLRQVGDALDYAHDHGVIHRDIKPSNIVFQGGRALLCDFGIARSQSTEVERLSSISSVMGTPDYMSPEQAAGVDDPTSATDIYSLACVAYEMLVGEPVFAGATPQIVMSRHLRDHPPSLRVVRPEVSEQMERALHRALAKSPATRPKAVVELLKAAGVAAPSGL